MSHRGIWPSVFQTKTCHPSRCVTGSPLSTALSPGRCAHHQPSSRPCGRTISLHTAPKTSHCVNIVAFSHFLILFFFFLIVQTPSRIHVNALSACNLSFSKERKKWGMGVNLFYANVPVFLGGTTGLFKFFRCLSADHFRFPKIKVRIPNPAPLSSSVSLSLICQVL